jgi:hypothetical protein
MEVGYQRRGNNMERWACTAATVASNNVPPEVSKLRCRWRLVKWTIKFEGWIDTLVYALWSTSPQAVQKYRAGPQPVHVFMIHSFTLAWEANYTWNKHSVAFVGKKHSLHTPSYVGRASKIMNVFEIFQCWISTTGTCNNESMNFDGFW